MQGNAERVETSVDNAQVIHDVVNSYNSLCYFDVFFRVFVVGMIALAEVIAESKTILRMDIRENEPYVGGLMALSLSLKVNESLVRIDLDKELKKEPVSLQCRESDVDDAMNSLY